MESFELCEVSPKIQCPGCLGYWTEGIVYCNWRTCLVPTEFTRKLNRDRLDAFVSEVRREYHQAFRTRINSIQFFKASNDVKHSDIRNHIWDGMRIFFYKHLDKKDA